MPNSSVLSVGCMLGWQLSNRGSGEYVLVLTIARLVGENVAMGWRHIA